MKISFLTSGHYYKDDRIFYHMARSLFAIGNKVEIISSKIDWKEISEGININCFDGEESLKKNKVDTFVSFLKKSDPDLIICSEPLPLIAAKEYKTKSVKKVKILYDITEWYPSKINLHTKKYPFKVVHFFKLLLFNIYASSKTDGFIFGEWYKSKPYRFLYRSKPFVYTTYYPDLNYIKSKEPDFDGRKINLCHSGKMSKGNGYVNFIKVVQKLSEIMPELLIEVKVIGWYEAEKDKEECERLLSNNSANINYTFYPKQSYESYIQLIRSTDIFLDLRSDDYEGQRSLPIKLFYYTALGRPVLFSDLKAIRKEVEIQEFGRLVRPKEIKEIAEIVKNYVLNKELYLLHCKNALTYAQKMYNWKKIEPAFLNFIQSMQND
jgi:glycosyltransferase involved in cell wall biosynthesis